MSAQMNGILSQYRSRSRLNELDGATCNVEGSVSQYRSRSRLNEQHRFQWIRFSYEIMLLCSHPDGQRLAPFVHFFRKSNGFYAIKQEISSDISSQLC